MADKNLADCSGKWGDDLEKITDATSNKNGATIAIVGLPGRGKTQMAVESLRRNIWQADHPSGKFIDMPRMLMEAKSPYQTKGVSEIQILERFTSPRFLVIDDVDRRIESVWENNLIHAILDARYREMKSTIITANQTPEALINSMGVAICSRINEWGGIITCDGRDFRKKGGV